MKKHTKHTTMLNASAATTESQIPSMPSSNGKREINIIWKNNVRIKEMIADVTPSFNAVKNPDEKMQKPHKPKERPYNLNPWAVMSKSSLSPAEKMAESGLANTSTMPTKAMLKRVRISKLFLSKLLSSV